MQNHNPTVAALLVLALPVGAQPGAPSPRGPTAPVGAPIRVLYLETAPRWEYRYLSRALLRAPDVAAQVYLCSAPRGFEQLHASGLPPLRAVPRGGSALGRYDVILLGDVGPAQLGGAAAQRAFAGELARFVAAGGGLGVIAGGLAMPGAWRGTAVERLLPVEVDFVALQRRGVHRPRPVWMQEIPGAVVLPGIRGGKIHPILRLGADVRVDVELCHSLPLGAYMPVKGLRPGAEVVFEHSRARVGAAFCVVAAVRREGAGRTFFLGIDDTWRWRRVGGGRLFARFWHNVVGFLAGREVPGETGRRTGPGRGR